MRLNLPKLAAVCLSFASAGCLQLVDPVHSSFAPNRENATRRAASAVAAVTTAAQGGVDQARGLFPLEIGNRWRYSFTSASVGPNVPGGRSVGLIGTHTIELVGRTRIGPFEYVVARLTTVDTLVGSGVTDTLVSWAGYREDSAGLYELPNPRLPSVAGSGGTVAATEYSRAPLLGLPAILPQTVNVIPTSAAQPGELKLLSYPLHVATAWTLADPIQATVEGVEVLDLPVGRLPAYRVKVYLPGLEEDYQIQNWWSRRGLLKDRRYIRARCLDPICPPPDTFGEFILTVQEIHLEGRAPQN
jgi:hypothetical protein